MIWGIKSYKRFSRTPASCTPKSFHVLVIPGALIKSFGAVLKCPLKIIKAMAGI